MSTSEAIEITVLNVMSIVVIAVPNWWTLVPHIEHWVEFTLKVFVAVSLIAVNVSKFSEYWQRRKDNRNKPTPSL
jgi:hypothetical protein